MPSALEKNFEQRGKRAPAAQGVHDAAQGQEQAQLAHHVQQAAQHKAPGVLRGLHYQLPPAAQGKLVHVVAGIPSTTLFFRNYYIGLPDELIKAAQLDGAGFWMIFRRIVLPLSLPILVVTLIWQFTNIWNDFLYGVVFSGADSKPITVGLNNLANTSSAVKEYNVDMAAALIAALPTLFVYVVAGKYFVRGLTAGAVKG